MVLHILVFCLSIVCDDAERMPLNVTAQIAYSSNNSIICLYSSSHRVFWTYPVQTLSQHSRCGSSFPQQ